MKQAIRLFSVIGSTALLVACAGGSDRYPSLSVRPGERASGTFDVPEDSETSTPAPVANASLLERVAQLGSDARAAHDTFSGITPRARALVEAAQGAETGSDRWASAQVALAELDSARSMATIALAGLDTLYVDQTLDEGALEQIAATRGGVLVLLKDEDSTLATLRGMLDS